jgi:hypothetical protein
MSTPIDYLKFLGLLVLVISVLIGTARLGAYRAHRDIAKSRDIDPSLSTIFTMVVSCVLSVTIIVVYIILVWPIN